jgi:hypothetical protein
LSVRPSRADRPVRRARPCRLGFERLEDRLTPSTITFDSGILFIQDTAGSNNLIAISPAGSHHDGSTGVRVYSNLTGWHTQTFGDASHPVTKVSIALKDGNNLVAVGSLTGAQVLMGVGNGNNLIAVGDTQATGLIAGSGRNIVSLGGGTDAAFSGYDPRGGFSTAATVALVGESYLFDPDGAHLHAPSIIGNDSNNLIAIHDRAGQSALVDINGNGSNLVATGDGDDVVWVQGHGNNVVDGDEGVNVLEVDGDGNNRVSASGTGSITIHGQGNNQVDAGPQSGDAVSLVFTGTGGHNVVTTTNLADVQVNGVTVTAPGLFDGTNTIVRLLRRHAHHH